MIELKFNFVHRCSLSCVFRYCLSSINKKSRNSFVFVISGSTAERVCLAGDSAGGNLCITVCMKAISSGIRVPDGIMAAYPATLLTTDASPSRLLTLIDPLLPLGVLAKCLNAYAGMWVQVGYVLSQSDFEYAVRANKDTNK